MRKRFVSSIIVGCLSIGTLLLLKPAHAVVHQSSSRSRKDDDDNSMFAMVHRPLAISSYNDRIKTDDGDHAWENRHQGLSRCWSNYDCPSGRFCHFSVEAENSCGKHKSGVCKRLRQFWRCRLEEEAYVCGCDSKPYANECFAFAAGVSVSSLPTETCMSLEPSPPSSSYPSSDSPATSAERGASESNSRRLFFFSFNIFSWFLSLQPSTPPPVLSDIPSSTPSSSVAPSEDQLSNPSSLPSDIRSETPSRDPSLDPSLPPSDNPSSDTSSVAPSATPLGDASNDPSSNPSATPSEGPSIVPTAFPSVTPSDVPSIGPSSMPSGAPDIDDSDPSPGPSTVPSDSPFIEPFFLPSSAPSNDPSLDPLATPSEVPTETTSDSPSVAPSKFPTTEPSLIPSNTPTMDVSSVNTSNPSVVPSQYPSRDPSSVSSTTTSEDPSMAPSNFPSVAPSDVPSIGPSSIPSDAPGIDDSDPSLGPSTVPSDNPSTEPSFLPSTAPSNDPSLGPLAIPSEVPTETTSYSPSVAPSKYPTTEPSLIPSNTPTMDVSSVNTGNPSVVPSQYPSRDPSSVPSATTSEAPSMAPSNFPSVAPSDVPSIGPSSIPSDAPDIDDSDPSLGPSTVPSDSPSTEPFFLPSTAPINDPSLQPSAIPSGILTDTPTQDRSNSPTSTVSAIPSEIPTSVSSHRPSAGPSDAPTMEKSSLRPSLQPSSLPSTGPSSYPSDIPSITCSTITATTLAVSSSDTVLVRPSDRRPIIAPITGYNWRGFTEPINWASREAELPIYNNIDRNSHQYWNYLVDELLLSRVPVVMMHGRGCWDRMNGTVILKETLRGSGDMCPRLLKGLVAAVRRAGAEKVLKFGMWDDTGSYPDAFRYLNGLEERVPVDLSNEDNWRYFWDRNIKLWFDTIPQEWWYLIDGERPVIASWVLRDSFFENQQGNASRLLDWIKLQFMERYNVTPAFILDRTWTEKDTTIEAGVHAYGKHDWFKPVSDIASSVYSYAAYNNITTGVVLPSFRNGGSPARNCGTECREVTRRNGTTLELAMTAGQDQNATFTLLESWTNMVESAGFYRSLEWSYPTQYLNIVRRYADPYPETLRFEAEGADRFWDSTPGNVGGQYRDEDLDIGELSSLAGWYVGWTVAGEWLEYQNVHLGSGTYRFTARVATTTEGQMIRLDLDGLESVVLPCTGSNNTYALVHLGEWTIESSGSFDLRVIFETGGTNLDWFFLKKKNEI